MGKLVVPTTVAMAKALGWTAIQVECQRAECAGRHTTEIPWTMITGGEDRQLAGIVRKLICRHCRQRPTGINLHRLVADNDHGPPTSRLLSIAHLAER